jgi:hypothetical protein
MQGKVEFSGLCTECGTKYGKGLDWSPVSTYHTGRCFCCGEVRAVTEERDYGYPEYTYHPDFVKEINERLENVQSIPNIRYRLNDTRKGKRLRKEV